MGSRLLLICELLALAQQALEPVFTPKLSGGGRDEVALSMHLRLAPIPAFPQ